MGKTMQEVRTLKVGRYMIVDDEPCKIVDYSTSKPGKHGEAKAKIVVVGLFDSTKRTVVHPVKHKVSVPMIERSKAQVVSIQGDEVQLMDLESYEMFNVPIPEDLKDALEAGQEVSYMDALGRKMITRT